MSERLERATTRRNQPAAEPRTRVLIVDDQDQSRRVCAGYCDLFDHESETARTGAEAVAALRRGRFDVVVMNVHMENGEALETVRQIRRLRGPAGQAPIVGLTAIGRSDEAQRWLSAGLTGVLAKPVSAARLYAALGAARAGFDGSERSWAPA